MRQRTVFLVAAAGVVVLLAVGIPWTISALHSDSAPKPSATVPPGTSVGDRLGAAVQLVAAARDVRPDTGDVAALSAAEQDFALSLLTTLGADDNRTASPASLAVALSMLEHGAGGHTLDELQKTLRTSALSPDAQGAAWQALTGAWSAAAKDGSFQLESANSLWQQNGFPLRSSFLQALRTYYDAGVWQADLTSPAGLDAINKWTAEHTDGKIQKLFDQLPGDAKAVLANAIYFKAKWQTPFDAHDTHDGQFIAPSGPVTASFMKLTGALACSDTGAYSAVQLPYQGGRFAALAIMPKSGSLADFVAGLTAGKLQTIASGLSNQSVSLAMPRFELSSTLDLNSALAKLGMPTAFTDNAEFPGLSSTPLKISQVVQRVYLKVAEKGTEAAAATGVVMVPTMGLLPGPTISLNHPFLFLIRDTQTGAILFESAVSNPAA